MEDRPKSRPPWLEIGITLGGIAAIALLVFLVPPLHDAATAAIHGDTDEVRRQIDELGVAGPLLIIALCLLHAVVMYPAEIVDAAAGFAYGFFPALALVTVGWMLSAPALLCVRPPHGRPLLDRWFGAERFERFERMIERGGVTLLLALRLIPIMPFSLVGYAAGAARVPLGRFVWTTAVGYLPITALAVYFGTRLEGITPTDPLVIGTAAAALALLLVGHWIVRRQAGEEGGGVSPPV